MKMSFYATSIYIPRMSMEYNEDTIRTIMESYQIGTVSHIDFIPINKKPGFIEKFDQVMMSAFIYFSDPWFYSADDSYGFKSEIGNVDFWNRIAEGEPCRLDVSPKEYWICLKNKKPIQRTMMNIHQVVENGRYLENLLQEQGKKIEELERKLEVTNNIVNQLIGISCQVNNCKRRLDELENKDFVEYDELACLQLRTLP
jgi:tetrahydromethanopterin S-methyltransferase subunit G